MSYCCPGCGNTDEEKLVELIQTGGGLFKTIDHDTDYYGSQFDEVSLFVCKKCQCVQTNHWRFSHKGDNL